MGSNPTPRTIAEHSNSGAAVGYSLWLKKEGYRESTILRYSKIIRTLGKTANLYEAEAVKSEIANKDWLEGTKGHRLRRGLRSGFG